MRDSGESRSRGRQQRRARLAVPLQKPLQSLRCEDLSYMTWRPIRHTRWCGIGWRDILMAAGESGDRRLRTTVRATVWPGGAGGKSGLRRSRARKGWLRRAARLVTPGGCASKARKCRSIDQRESAFGARLRKVPQKIKPPVSFDLGGRPKAKPLARLLRSSAFGKGEKVG